MRRIARWTVGCCLLAACVSAAPPATRPAIPSSERLRRLAESVAAQLPWMGQDFLYDRTPSFGPDASRGAALWASLRDPPATGPFDYDPLRLPPWSADDVRELLRHADPKVRSLAIMLAYQFNRVDMLPDLAPLAYDEAASFPVPAQLALAVNFGPTTTWPMEPQTVGAFARGVIATYVRASADLEPLRPAVDRRLKPTISAEQLRQALEAFAAKRDPTLCTAALRIAMQRATGGTTPVSNDRRDRALQVIGLLQRIPMPRRFFVALALDFQDHAGDRYSPDFLLNMARQVPRDVRLKTLRGEPAIDDRDLYPGFGNWYLLAHVTDLFQVADADLFLRMADDAISKPDNNQVGDILAAGYQVPAARLRPADADAILCRAMDRLGDRHDYSADHARETLALAMAQIGGEPSLRRAVDWVFTMRPEPGSYGGGREGLMGAVAADNPARARLLYERLIRDPRLDTLGPASSRVLIEAAQGYLGRPLASDDEINQQNGDEAQRDGPFKPLAAWHKALRATVDEWSK